ncbi:PREDICTED: dual specificity protein phosphatase 15-like, partial [Merops nubicus]|uniref:dual specificity protein phosphatase 15-like n=1 Tax=Merops nubicus TaxID=57421 RepID=UPI0004F0737B
MRLGCQGYIQPRVLDARAAAQVQLHPHGSCPGAGDVNGRTLAFLVELAASHSGCHDKVTAHAATSCAPQILPGLYLGNFIDAKDLEQLSRNKITHIVSIHESPQPLLQDITYLRIPLPDTPEANIKRHFKECISFIHQCRLHGGNCLVHCLAGISRSTTVVVAYVMAVTELSFQEVLEAVRAVRPVANPNPGFRQQLADFGGGSARKVRRHLKQRYGPSPFNDEEEIKALLPTGRGGSSRTEGARQGLVPRGRDMRSTTPFLLRVKR